MKVLVTGAAGFIGMHLARRLLEQGSSVVGVDNFNPYYDVRLKRDRWALLAAHARFAGVEMDLSDAPAALALVETHRPTHVAHLAAQAGVRYSLVNPHAYTSSNVVAFVNLLEAVRAHPVEHFVYASSSSVYGANNKLPFSEDDRADHPVSLYAATKRANELIAHSYSHLFGLRATGLRFFTVYGPWGRPDMSAFLFTRAILAGEPIRVFNHGRMQRDFTYVDDIVEGVVRLLPLPPAPGEEAAAPCRVANIGNHTSVELETFISTLERVLGRAAIRDYQPMQPGDVVATYADTRRIRALTGFAPRTPLEEGLRRFADWYREYYAARG